MERFKITRDMLFSADEVRHLLKVCEEQANLDLLQKRRAWITRRALVALALQTGLKQGEIMTLKIGDLHLKSKKPYIRVRDENGVKKRDVHFIKDLAMVLEKYIKIKGEKWNRPNSADDYLFTNFEGKHFSRTALHLSFKKALEKAGLPLRYSLRNARHTYAANLLTETGDLKYVQKQLGHESIAFTVTYANILSQ